METSFKFYSQKERNFDYIRRENLLPKNRCKMGYPSYSLICLPFSTNNGKNKAVFIARERNKQVLNISKEDSGFFKYIYIYISNFNSHWTTESLKADNFKILFKKCLNCRRREKQEADGQASGKLKKTLSGP